MIRLLPLLLLAACAERDPCPATAMIDGPGGLVLTEAEHPDGWGAHACFACHDEAVLHHTACTPDVDIEALQARVAAEGTDSCVDCHGDNGVSP